MATRVVYVTVFLGFLFGLVAWLEGGGVAGGLQSCT